MAHLTDVNCMKKYLNEETIAEEKYSKYFLEDLSCTERLTEINFFS